MEGKTIITKYCKKARIASEIFNKGWGKCKHDMKYRKILSHISKRCLKIELRNELTNETDSNF